MRRSIATLLVAFLLGGCRAGKPAHCILSEWTDWTRCLTTDELGNGWFSDSHQSFRKRIVLHGRGPGGTACSGNLKETHGCALRTHVATHGHDCEFDDWGPWNQPGQDLSYYGQRGRSRHIKQHARGQGAQCEGALEETTPLVRSKTSRPWDGKYAFGERGQDACPAGYVPISSYSQCEHAWLALQNAGMSITKSCGPPYALTFHGDDEGSTCSCRQQAICWSHFQSICRPASWWNTSIGSDGHRVCKKETCAAGFSTRQVWVTHTLQQCKASTGRIAGACVTNRQRYMPSSTQAECAQTCSSFIWCSGYVWDSSAALCVWFTAKPWDSVGFAQEVCAPPCASWTDKEACDMMQPTLCSWVGSTCQERPQNASRIPDRIQKRNACRRVHRFATCGDWQPVADLCYGMGCMKDQGSTAAKCWSAVKTGSGGVRHWDNTQCNTTDGSYISVFVGSEVRCYCTRGSCPLEFYGRSGSQYTIWQCRDETHREWDALPPVNERPPAQGRPIVMPPILLATEGPSEFLSGTTLLQTTSPIPSLQQIQDEVPHFSKYVDKLLRDNWDDLDHVVQAAGMLVAQFANISDPESGSRIIDGDSGDYYRAAHNHQELKQGRWPATHETHGSHQRQQQRSNPNMTNHKVHPMSEASSAGLAKRTRLEFGQNFDRLRDFSILIAVCGTCLLGGTGAFCSWRLFRAMRHPGVASNQLATIHDPDIDLSSPAGFVAL